MASENHLAENAEAEIFDAVLACKTEGYSEESRRALWEVFQRWLNDQRLLSAESLLRVVVLNELTFRLSDENLREEAWEIFRGLAREYGSDHSTGMGISLTISTFELFVEEPVVPETMRLLFSLADDPETRWAVFAAYENIPARLKTDASLYSDEKITAADCDVWLRRQPYCEYEDQTQS